MELDEFINGLPLRDPAPGVKLAEELTVLPAEVLASLAGIEQPKTAGAKVSRLVGSSSMGRCDGEFLEQFEGSPLHAQAVAIAEQELEMEKRHLQARMERRLRDDSWEQESNERDMLDIQKSQLMLELHKAKDQEAQAAAMAAMPAVAPPAAAPELPAEAPPEAAAAKMASAAGGAGAAAGRSIAEKHPHLQLGFDAHEDKADIKAVLPFGSTYIGAARAGAAGKSRLGGAARGVAGGLSGALAGSVPGSIVSAAGAGGLGQALRGAGATVGNVYGTHLATRHYLKGKKKGGGEKKKESALTDAKQEKGLGKAMQGLAKKKGMDPDQKAGLAKGLMKAVKKEKREGDPVKLSSLRGVLGI